MLKVSEPVNQPIYERSTKMMAMSASDQPEITVDAGELEVSATVEVRFALEQD